MKITLGDRQLLKSLDGKGIKMTKEELIAAGLTEEQAAAVFAMNGRDITALRGQIGTLTEQNTQLQADSAELATLRQQSMTAEQLQQQAIDAANAEKEKYTKLLNSTKAREALISGGMKPEEIDEDLIGILLGEDETTTVSRCKAYTDKISAKLQLREQELREELLKGAGDPPKGTGSNDTDTLSAAELKAKEIAPTLSGGTVDLSRFE